MIENGQKNAKNGHKKTTARAKPTRWKKESSNEA
jgi:hypothetical protein